MWKYFFITILFLQSIYGFIVPMYHNHELKNVLYAYHNNNELQDVLTYCEEHVNKLNKCNGENTVLYLSTIDDDRSKRIQKRINKLAEDFPTISFYNLSVKPNDYELFMSLRVSAVPFFILYRNGERIYQHSSFDAMLIHKIISLLK